jgi:hypothetical protein
MNPEHLYHNEIHFAIFCTSDMSSTQTPDDYLAALAAYTTQQDTYARLPPPPPPLVAPTTGHLSDDGHDPRHQVTGPTQVD